VTQRPFSPQSNLVKLVVGTLIMACLITLATGIAAVIRWAAAPMSVEPQTPPVLHVFHSDLTIISPHPVITPTTTASWPEILSDLVA
jgi:hypothetical protein